MGKKGKKKNYYREELPIGMDQMKHLCYQAFEVRMGNNIPRQNQLEYHKDSGVFFGVAGRLGREYFIGKNQREDGHILFVGGPGSGKTSGSVLMSLGTWGGRIIALDIKGDDEGLAGDLPKPWFELNKKKGKNVKIFNPTKDYSSHYEPFAFLQYDGKENLISNARDLALSILPTPPHLGENGVWIKLAQNLLTATILHYFSIGATFNQAMGAIQKFPVEQLIKNILNDDEDVKTELEDDIEISVEMFISKLQGLRPEILAGIGMDFGEFVALAVDPFVKSAFSCENESDVIDWNDFNSEENVYDVILQIPESRLEVWEPMTALMINQLIKTLERRADQYSARSKKLQPILILLDEFPRLGTCHAVKNGLATLRSRGVTFALFIQNLAQLDERYGTEGRRDILGCCSYKALLSVTEPDDQEYFSRLIGTVKTGQRNVGANITVDGEVAGYNMNITEARERIVEPEELGYLGKELILITPRGFCRIDKGSFYDKQCRECLIPPPPLPINFDELGFEFRP